MPTESHFATSEVFSFPQTQQDDYSNDVLLTSLRVSLIIPVRDEATTIPEMLAGIKSQTRQPDEVVVVDGGSTDYTVTLLRAAAQNDPAIRIIEAVNATPGSGRNIGIAAATYEWIALTDAGTRLEPKWLEHLLRVPDRDPATVVVYGNYEPIVDSFFERCAALAYVPPKQMRPGGRTRGPSIASCLLRRDVWQKVGGFPDLRAAEDLMFMEAIEVAGIKTGWAPTATIWWHLRPSWKSTFKRFALYSKYNVWAGRQRFWHYGIARQYVLGLPFLALGLGLSLWWLLVPLAGLLARAGKSIWQRREKHGIGWLLNPLQLMGVALILLTIDAATFVGWIQARLVPPPKRTTTHVPTSAPD